MPVLIYLVVFLCSFLVEVVPFVGSAAGNISSVAEGTAALIIAFDSALDFNCVFKKFVAIILDIKVFLLSFMHFSSKSFMCLPCFFRKYVVVDWHLFFVKFSFGRLYGRSDFKKFVS